MISLHISSGGTPSVCAGLLTGPISEVYEEGDGESPDSETTSLLSCTLRFVSLTDLDYTSLGCDNRYTCVHEERVTEFIVYYESIKWELKIRFIYECRCDERLQAKTKEFTHLTYTGLVVELEHLKIETRLIDEKFVNVMGEYVT